jgi:hypothetical protein
MNKLAAEKIAQEYYDLGAQLALSKTAGATDKILRNTSGLYGAGLGALASPLATGGLLGERALNKAMSALGGSGTLDGEAIGILAAMAPAALAGGIVGARGATKGHDKLVELLRAAK